MHGTASCRPVLNHGPYCSTCTLLIRRYGRLVFFSGCVRQSVSSFIARDPCVTRDLLASNCHCSCSQEAQVASQPPSEASCLGRVRHCSISAIPERESVQRRTTWIMIRLLAGSSETVFSASLIAVSFALIELQIDPAATLHSIWRSCSRWRIMRGPPPPQAVPPRGDPSLQMEQSGSGSKFRASMAAFRRCSDW